MAETAIFSSMAVFLAFAMLALIPLHRARSAAVSAAYSCAQFISQSPNPAWAAYQARRVALATLEADWSGTLGVEYEVQALPADVPGGSAGCVVFFRPPLRFGGHFGIPQPGWSAKAFVSQAEAWKARWR
jgi:hypothetical protein